MCVYEFWFVFVCFKNLLGKMEDVKKQMLDEEVLTNY